MYILCVYAIMAPAHESETIVFNFRKLLSTLPNYAELEQILLFRVNRTVSVHLIMKSSIIAILFRPLELLTPKTLKLFGFPTFILLVYLMKIIPEMRRAHKI